MWAVDLAWGDIMHVFFNLMCCLNSYLMTIIKTPQTLMFSIAHYNFYIIVR